MKNFVPVSSTPQNKWKNFFRNLKADTKVVENLNRIVSVNETKFLFKNLSTKKPSHMALLVNSSKRIMKKKIIIQIPSENRSQHYTISNIKDIIENCRPTFTMNVTQKSLNICKSNPATCKKDNKTRPSGIYPEYHF